MASEKYTAQQMIDALTDTKGMITLAARRLGCASNTIRRYIKEYPTVAAAQIEQHEQMGDTVELALYDEAINKRNTAALIFLAKTKFKERGFVERTETRAINLDVSALTDEQLTRIAAGEEPLVVIATTSQSRS